MRMAPCTPLTTTLRSYSPGMRGVRQTLGVMRRLVNDGKIDPLIRSTATSIIYLAPEKDDGTEASKLLDFVQRHIRYVKDIHDIETLSTAPKTLAGRVGDCDDQTVLLAALLESVGYPTRFVVASYGESTDPEHVYLQTLVDDEWLDADPTENFPLGVAPPNPSATYIERI